MPLIPWSQFGTFYHQFWNMKHRKLIIFDDKSLLQSAASISSLIKSVSSLFGLNSNVWTRGLIGTSPKGPFKIQNLISILGCELLRRDFNISWKLMWRLSERLGFFWLSLTRALSTHWLKKALKRFVSK